MKEIQINQLIELGENYYYILNFYFTDKRVMCELITDAERFYSPDLRDQKGRLIQEWRSSNRKVEECNLYINGVLHQWQGGFIHHISSNPTHNAFLQDIVLPKCLQGKELVLVEEEYEPFDLNEEIMQIHFAKEKRERIILIQKELHLPIGKIHKPYEISYEDSIDKKIRKLYIHQLYTVDISHLPHLRLRGRLSNQIPLIAQIEVEDDIEKANIFIKKNTQEDFLSNIPLKQIEAPAKNQQAKDGFQYRNNFVGMINSTAEKVSVVVFSSDVKRKVEKKVIVYDHWDKPYVR